MRILINASLVILLLCTIRADADWERFRGPRGDGIVEECKWNPLSLASNVKILWRDNIGAGYSSLTIRGKWLYTAGYTNGNNVIYCMEAATGKKKWEYSFRSGRGQGGYVGPRSTPVSDGAYVYFVGQEGEVICLDSNSGYMKWEKNLAKDFGAKAPTWGYSASPWLEDEMLILNANTYGIAIKKKTGEKIWSSPEGIGGYATPVVYSSKGKKCAAIFGQKAIYGVDITSGELLWSFPWKTAYDVHAADPIVYDNKVFFTSGYGTGCALIEIGEREPKLLWQNKNICAHFSSCVLLKGVIYGINGNAGGGALRAVDFSSGSLKWSENLGFGSLIALGDKLVVFSETGTLTVADATPAGYKCIATHKLMEIPAKIKCWTAPVFNDGIIYCRNSAGDIMAVDVSK